MDRRLRDYLRRKSDGRYERDYAERTDYRRDRRGQGSVDFEGNMDFEDGRDYRMRRDHRDREDYGTHEEMRLSKSDLRRWNSMFVNFDGSRGGHYDASQVMKASEKLNIRFNEYSEREFHVAVNMMYADYGSVLKKHLQDSEAVLHCCAELAKAFLDDPDGPEPSEKLALYFHCVVDCE